MRSRLGIAHHLHEDLLERRLGGAELTDGEEGHQLAQQRAAVDAGRGGELEAAVDSAAVRGRPAAPRRRGSRWLAALVARQDLDHSWNAANLVEVALRLDA